jgi:hypothetical protein
MNEMIGRIARIIWPEVWEPLAGPASVATKEGGRQVGGWAYQLELRAQSVEKAKAVLTEMREPTEAMVAAAGQNFITSITVANDGSEPIVKMACCAEAWPKMIDAALAEAENIS